MSSDDGIIQGEQARANAPWEVLVAHRFGFPNEDGEARCRCGRAVVCSDKEAAQHVLDEIRSLPIEQRMEAMGMVQHDDSCRNDGHGGHWHAV